MEDREIRKETTEIRMETTEIMKENTAADVIAGNQVYMGTPAGVILCVDAMGDRDSTGLSEIDAYLWHGYRPDALRVTVPEHMLDEMEELFDLINYPRATTTLRSFSEEGSAQPQGGQLRAVQPQGGRNMPGTPKSVPRYLSDSELLQKRGALATFIIRVQQRANSSWQGRITWVEKDRTLRFRTIIEMVKLIEKALDSAAEALDSAAEARR